MNFREQCQKIVEATPGASACVLMGFDGIPIETFAQPDFAIDIPTLLTEYSAATLALRHAAQEQPDSGEVNELVITTPKLTTVLRPLSPEYFMAVILNADALTGKARFLMRMAAPAVLADLLS